MRGKKPEDIQKNKSIVNVSSTSGKHQGSIRTVHRAIADATNLMFRRSSRQRRPGQLCDGKGWCYRSHQDVSIRDFVDP